MKFTKREFRIEGGRRLYLYYFDDPATEVHARQRMFWSAVAQAWKDEREAVELWLKPVTDAITDCLGDGQGLLLDLGCGACTMPLPPGWTPIGVDLVHEMLSPGRNFVGSFCPLAVRSDSFDAAVSRFALMFAFDPRSALAEAFRALKPGGRLVLAVWGAAEQNLWSAIPMEIATARLGLSMPKPGDPHAFRLADEAEVREMLVGVGFSDCVSRRVEVPYLQSLSPGKAVEHVSKFAGPLTTLLQRMPETEREEVLRELEARFGDVDRTGLAIIWVSEKKP